MTFLPKTKTVILKFGERLYKNNSHPFMDQTKQTPMLRSRPAIQPAHPTQPARDMIAYPSQSQKIPVAFTSSYADYQVPRKGLISWRFASLRACTSKWIDAELGQRWHAKFVVLTTNRGHTLVMRTKGM